MPFLMNHFSHDSKDLVTRNSVQVNVVPNHVFCWKHDRKGSFKAGRIEYAGYYRSKELKENTVIVVLGASGDLAKKKTVRQFLDKWFSSFTP